MSLSHRLTLAACAMLSLSSISQAASFYYSDKAPHETMGAPREARYDMPYGAFRRCLPATGAQILGGFASPHDWLDPDTGEICNR